MHKLLFLIVCGEYVSCLSPEIVKLLTPLRRYGEGCGYTNCPPPQAGVGGINVHIVPYTHFEIGDVMNFDQHFSGVVNPNSTSKIDINMKRALDFVFTEMSKNSDLTFTISDMAYFFEWWKARDMTLRKVVYSLLREGRLSFVGGNWGQSDEAITSYHTLIESFTYTLRKLNATFMECGRPLVAWQADVNGHSREFASLVAQMGFDGLFIHPISYDDEIARMGRMALEMLWRGSDDLGMSTDIFTHVLFDGFWSPPGFCFGSECSDSRIITASRTFSNVKQRADEFRNSIYTRQWSSYNTSHMLVMMGMRDGYWDAPFWFENIKQLMFEVNHGPGIPYRPRIHMMYSSPHCYLQEVYKEGPPPLEPKQDDFMPVAFDQETLFVGHYTSFPSMKLLMREGLVLLQMAKQLQVLAQLDENNKVLEDFMWIIGAYQDHSVATGAATEPVKNYYTETLVTAMTNAIHRIIRTAFNVLRKSSAKEIYYRCSFNESICFVPQAKTYYIHVYNPLAWKVRLPIRFPIQHSGAKFTVHDPKGKLLPSALINIPDFVRKQRYHTVDHEVVFIAELPPLGFRKRSHIPKTNRTKRSVLQNETDNSSTHNKTPHSDPERTTTTTYPTIKINNSKNNNNENADKGKRSFAEFDPTTDKLDNDFLNEISGRWRQPTHDKEKNELSELSTPLSSQVDASEINEEDDSNGAKAINDPTGVSDNLQINITTDEKKTTNVYTYNDGIENYTYHVVPLQYDSTPASKSKTEIMEKIEFKALLDHTPDGDDSTPDFKPIPEIMEKSDFKALLDHDSTPAFKPITEIMEQSDFKALLDHDSTPTFKPIPEIMEKSDFKALLDQFYNSITEKSSIYDIDLSKTTKPQMKIIDYIRENELGKSHRFELTDEANKYLTQALKAFTTAMPVEPKNVNVSVVSNTLKNETSSPHIQISDKILTLTETPITKKYDNDAATSYWTYDFEENMYDDVKSKRDEIGPELSLNKSVEKRKPFDNNFLNLVDSGIDRDDKSNSKNVKIVHDKIDINDKHEKYKFLKFMFTVVPKTDIKQLAPTKDLNRKSKSLFTSNVTRNKGDFIPVTTTPLPIEVTEKLKIVNSLAEIEEALLPSETEEKNEGYDRIDEYNKKIEDGLSLPFVQVLDGHTSELLQHKKVKSDQTDGFNDDFSDEYDMMGTELPLDNKKNINTNGFKRKYKVHLMTTTPVTDLEVTSYHETENSNDIIKLDMMKFIDKVDHGYGSTRNGRVGKQRHTYRVHPTPEHDTTTTDSIDEKNPENFDSLEKDIYRENTYNVQPMNKIAWKFEDNEMENFVRNDTIDDSEHLLNFIIGSRHPDVQYHTDKNIYSEIKTSTRITTTTTTPATTETEATTTDTTTTEATKSKNHKAIRTTTMAPEVKTKPLDSRRRMKPLKTRKPRANLFIENEYIHIDIDPKTNKVIQMTLSNGVTMPLDLQFYYYHSDDPGLLRNGKIPPGAFVFRPLNSHAVPILDFISLKIVKSTVVEEAHFEYSNWTSLVIRLYERNPVIEVNWALGRIPVSDLTGKEVFIRYQTNLQNNGVFYTDSNGRQTIKRIRNLRPMYTPLNKDIIAGNFYPVTSKIHIEDRTKGLRFSVFPDRAEAGTSLMDGEIDLMIARRIFTDDQHGATYFFANQHYWVRGKHHLYLTKLNYHPNRIFEKKFAKEVLFTPPLFVSDLNPNRKHWMSVKNDVSLLEAKLPMGVHILTLQPWNFGAILLRLENYLEKSDTKKEGIKTVFLQQLFATIVVKRIEETTLGGNMWLKDHKPFRWLKKEKFIKNFNDYYSSGLDPEYQQDKEIPYVPVDLENGITLKPQQIRTFVCWIDLVDMDAVPEET